MGYSRFDPAMQGRMAWNAGKTVGTKRPLTQKQIWAIRFFLDRERRLRDRALFDLAIESKLRGCDLVKDAICDLVAGSDRALLFLAEESGGVPVQLARISSSQKVLPKYLELIMLELKKGGLVTSHDPVSWCE